MENDPVFRSLTLYIAARLGENWITIQQHSHLQVVCGVYLFAFHFNEYRVRISLVRDPVRAGLVLGAVYDEGGRKIEIDEDELMRRQALVLLMGPSPCASS